MAPRARNTDPTTSHEAAASASKTQRQSQRAVYRIIRDHGPMTDTTLLWMYRDHSRTPNPDFPRQSDSGIRTRRSELVEEGWVYDTGQREKLASGRNAIVWAVRNREQRREWLDAQQVQQEALFEDIAGGQKPQRGFYDPE